MHTALKKPFLPIIRALGKAVARRRFVQEPILIGGCGRSGTTLLLSMLSAHKEIFACPRELGLFNDTSRDKIGKLKAERIDRLYRTFIFNTIRGTAVRWCEKSPSNVRHIAELDEYFNGAFKFVHLVRDGRDVVLSVHPTSPDRYWVEPSRWVRDVEAGLAFADHPGVLTLRYEDLIADYDTTMNRLCQFAELPMSPELSNWHAHATVRSNSAYFTDVKRSHGKSVEKWKTTKDRDRIDKFMSEPRAAELLGKLGYEV